MAKRAHSRGDRLEVGRFEAKAQNAGKRVKIMRDVLLNGVLGINQQWRKLKSHR